MSLSSRSAILDGLYVGKFTTFWSAIPNIRYSTSEECYQDIWFSCFSAKLTKYAAWKDRNGDIQEHFTNNDTNVCNCHQNQSCFSVMPNINYCNCDTGDIVQREDTMRITNKVNT